MWLISITLLFATLWLLRYFLRNQNSAKLTYWKQQGFHILEETISGWDVFTGKGNVTDSDVEYYKELQRQKEPCGVVTELGTPIVIVKDLELAKDIFIKDFDNFTDRRSFGDVDKIFKDGLFYLEGLPWKNMRNFLSPTFTSGRIRKMFCHFEKSANLLTKFIRSHNLAKNSTHFDIPIVYTMRKFSMQVISSAAFGLKVNAFQDKDELVPMAERIFIFTIWKKIQLMISQLFPKLGSFLNIKIFDVEGSSFFWGLISSALQTRKQSGVKGNDFVQILVDAMHAQESAGRSLSLDKNKENEIQWNDDVAIPQAFAFIAAGFDTIANNLSVACYVLATHGDIQDELCREVDNVMGKNGGNILYEEINGMEYLDMFISEVLRLYPAVARLDRTCSNDYTLPQVGNGGKRRIIRKGTVIALPADAFHKDEQYFPNPLKFDPSRFNQENKARRNPYAYMPFGIGPRMCIGMRFAMVETKVALAYIVRNFAIKPTTGTPVPEKVDKDFLGYKVPSDVNLQFVLRK